MSIRHIVVIVRELALDEFITKLDSKGWSVMDIEPRTKYHPFMIAGLANIVSAILLPLLYSGAMLGTPVDFVSPIGLAAMVIAAIILIASLVFMSIERPYDYTIVCEYVGESAQMDMTPFDDTDDQFEYIDRT